MLKSSKRVLQISTALALLLGQTAIVRAQDVSPAPAPAAETKAPTTSVSPPAPAQNATKETSQPAVDTSLPAAPVKSAVQDAPPAPAPVTEISTPVTAPASPQPPAAAQAPAPIVEPKLSNSVAVLDLIVRREYRDFFYDEKHSAKTTQLKTPGAPMQGMPPTLPEGQNAPTRMPPASDESRQSESTYSKQYGIRTSISYQEINGVMTDIRTALRNAGYTVIRPHSSLAKKMEAGELTTVKDRMTAGDFGRAQYVLIPNVVDASVNETHEPIAGTSDFMKKFEMNLMVEFTMVDTETQAVIASFNAFGSGSDAYIGKEQVKHVPNFAKVRRELLKSFSADAREKLREQLPPTYNGKPLVAPQGKDGAPANIFEQGDPKTLKVYPVRDGKSEASKPAAEKQGDVTIYRK